MGCTKVGPGCDHCYAEALMDARYKRVKWGAGQLRSRTSAANWRNPIKWNAEPFFECACGWRGGERDTEPGVKCPACRVAIIPALNKARRRVFCASLADWLDNEAPIAWFVDLLELIRCTPNLDWLLLSKRIGNWKNRMDGAANWSRASRGRGLVEFIESWRDGSWQPPNAWLGATVVNQEEADRDIAKLLAVPARVRFLSIEPMLGPINLGEWAEQKMIEYTEDGIPCGYSGGSPLDWIIVGGESGRYARPMHLNWARSLRDQCQTAGVRFLFKQWGEWAPAERTPAIEARITMPGQNGAVWAWPNGTRDGWRNGLVAERVGKKAAGRALDGRTWDGFPEIQT